MKIKEQILAVQDTGLTNMFDTRAVQVIANEMGFYELVIFLEEHKNCEGCTGGVIYVTETYASLPWEFHVWESVVSSAWLYLIINNPDVLFPRTLRQVYYMVKTYNIKDERP